MRLLKFDGEESRVVDKTSSLENELTHFRSVAGNITQDALKVWADIWSELQDSVACDTGVTPEAHKGFEPSCGWSEFLEKMWVLRHHLEFLARFSRQG